MKSQSGEQIRCTQTEEEETEKKIYKETKEKSLLPPNCTLPGVKPEISRLYHSSAIIQICLWNSQSIPPPCSSSPRVAGNLLLPYYSKEGN